ncbi:PREDICTED: probable E3 ubiquitin-protein ligase HIP1 isoform X2 [Fragaria vesca subsp. vesca]|uniref:probable E3 ubiquitin-protein ligase HIP1 isoform X2 n=1 Tax=Fragaria vesca subsp. vesca TaxID=101020 RepID=UPI0002C32237|nr:PREDICTED: probable E3 ubiquitin-protein ligase HIP1 isoform X2 [Fragaria vesca subsp. vesca]
MQGQRGTIGSLPEMLDFDHGNTSNDAAIDQQICWNGTRNPSESRIPDYIESPTDMNVGFGNSVGRERRNLGRWCLGEPSSRNSQGEASRDERKPDFGWSSSVDACGEAGLRLEERSYEPTNNLSLDNNMNSIFTQSSNSDAIPQNLNLNAGFSGHGGDSSQAMECPSTYKYNVTETERTCPPGSSDPFLLPAASTGFLVGENDGRPGCSLEGRRVSCKRKTMEGHLGQSSLSGSCSYFPHTESGARPSAPAHYNAGINISSPSQERNPRLGPGGRELTADSLPDSNVGRGSESSHRNFRVRLNPSNQQSSIASARFSSGRAARHSSGSSSQLSPGLLPVDHSLDLRTAPVLDNMSSQNPPGLVHVPAIPQNVQSLRWNGGSSSRTGSLSNSVFMGDRDAPVREEVSSRSMARQILGHPIFVPATELRNSARLSVGSSSRNPTGANASVPGNVASTSRTGPSSSTHPASAPTWPHHNSHPQFPRRLSEYVRRSLFSAGGNESGNQGSNFLPMRSGNASSQEAVHSSGVANASHHQPHPRSAASWLERHGDGLGLPYSLRTLAAAGEGSNRLVSEICNVLGLMRRGESLRFEDVMILDQSMLFGVADIHDRHRDMRLDVDNMSYEELLALEERIGNVNTGLSEEIISNRLKHKKYIAMAYEAETETEPCCVCQEEYNEADDLGMLECGHDFHSDCIKQWLTHKNLCPICKTTALAT